ncbi:hypothetical protein PMI08_04741 [Brevibacillus sp. CF112]|nr:hypothetical protein PMI08_04741 [Brevibacillus sp. CF112]
MLFPNLPIKTAGGKVFWDTLDRRNVSVKSSTPTNQKCPVR